MRRFIKITPENHHEVISAISGKLYILYFSSECIFCREAIKEIIAMPENDLFTYAVCQVDDCKEFRMQENILSMPTVRIYENGLKIFESNGYNETRGTQQNMRGSITKCENYHTVYADNAATTKMSKKALKAYADCAKENYGNPSTNYEFGTRAKEYVVKSRMMIREGLNISNGDLIFTGGGSEADNLALYSAYKEGIAQNKRHIITTAVEHHAVLHTLEAFKADGFEITILGVNKKGIVSLKQLRESIRPDTILVSVMFANNETGTIQPIAEIGKICRKNGILFHCDAVQAIGHVEIDFEMLNVDYMSMAAHKFNGPKGVGALAVSKDAPIYPMILGGGQEKNRRAGTENVQGIYSMAVALTEHLKHLKRNNEKINEIMEVLISGIKDVPGAVINGDMQRRLPGTVNFSFKKVHGRELLFLLDAKYGICVSGGSACNTNSKLPSHVLLAMGLSEELAESAVRISISPDNTIEDAEYIIKALHETIKTENML